MAGEDLSIQGQAYVWDLTWGYVDAVVLRCALDLKIADIINSHSNSITLSEIADGISSPSLDISCLFRIMRFLVRKRVFTSNLTENGTTLYGLTDAAKWLLQDAELTLAPIVQMQSGGMKLHPFKKNVKEGGNMAEPWDKGAARPEYNERFNAGMACTAKIVGNAVLLNYENGFDGVKSLVDVGGGLGLMIGEIVKAHPHISGINFDLPHVVATAPEYPGVVHVSGNMFLEIPEADAVIMKWILHDYDDDKCVKLLKNCHKVLSKNGGKLIIVDAVLDPEGKGPFDDIIIAYDMVMMATTIGGKERTEAEWKKILECGGFPNYKIIRIPALLSIIEAYPK
ncbi:hypothetical protein AQUCO_00700125v1 [Aquilegia coerulea]|uniref:O-methyltransferase domain-containing protein n=1 Tax=Aquilegia coerulea TaxID=218851 RepID=A0A2G5EIN5_AQUCA|nr:hypothetical protein AQUCO_00700125v1 [Aquilegia coerulea]